MNLDQRLGKQLIAKLTAHDPEEKFLGIENINEEEKLLLNLLVCQIVRTAQLMTRRHSRIDTRLYVSLRIDDMKFNAETKDLSIGGMFLFSDQPVSVGDELEFTLFLPAGMPPLDGRAKVIHTGHAVREGMLPGFELQFVSADMDTLRQFLIWLFLGGVRTATDRRRHGRIKKTLRTHLSSAPKYTTLIRDISLSGVFLQTEFPAIEGTKMEMTLVNPLTLQKLQLTGKVVRVLDSDPDNPDQVQGMGVAIDDMEKDQLDRLLTFLVDIIILEASYLDAIHPKV